MCGPGHSITILVSGTVTIWPPHKHNGLFIKQRKMHTFQKEILCLYAKFQERIGGLITIQPTMIIRV